MGVSIKDGGVALSINLGNGRLDTGIKNKNVRFDDDVWHHVVIFRVAQQVRKRNYTHHLQRGHPTVGYSAMAITFNSETILRLFLHTYT